MNASTEPAGSLQRALSDQTAHLHMATPVADILNRGNALTRRRRRVVVGGLAAGAIAAAACASVVASPGSSPLVPQAQAAWGPSMVNLPDSVLYEAERQCGPVINEMGMRLPDEPVAADSRNGETLAVYRDDAAYAICNFRGDTAPDLQIASAAQDDWTDLPPGAPARFLTGTFAQAHPSDPLTDAAGVLQVPTDVERLLIEFDGRTWESAVVEGFALFWLPDGVSDKAFDDAIVTTYDADDRVLATDKLAGLYR